MNANPLYIVKLLTGNGQEYYVNSFKEKYGRVVAIFIMGDITRAHRFEKLATAEEVGKLRMESDSRIKDFEIITL